MKKLRVLDLFSGIGGFSLGLERAGMETVAFCEYDEKARKVLKKHWPDVPIHEDIRRLDGKQYRGTIDVICGGFPCQPFSHAGKRRGKEDDRDLWPEMFRVIQESKPAWVLGENVAGFVNMEFERTASNLESEGYEVQAFIIPACAVNAPHRRDRVWIVAYSEGQRANREAGDIPKENGGPWRALPGVVKCSSDVADSKCGRSSRQGELKRSSYPAQDKHGEADHVDYGGKNIERMWDAEPNVGITDDGIPARLERGIENANAKKERPGSLLQIVWGEFNKEEIQRQTGRSECFPKKTILQPGLHGQGLCQRHAIEVGIAQTGYKIPWDDLRIVWGHKESSQPSYRRELAQRLARQHSDLVRELSYFPPPPCSACWADGSWEEGIARVENGVKNRVDRLKQLGNAVVPQVVEIIGRAIVECNRLSNLEVK